MRMNSSSGGEVVIRTEGLSKNFGDVEAVQQLNLTVHRGEVYAFLGRNGAGKSTTIRMMLALIKPTDGWVEILGYRMVPNAVQAFERIGSLLEVAGAYENLTVRENLDMQRDLLGLRRDHWVNQVVELCNLGEYMNRRAGTLSLGNRQRLGLARALLHKPEILVLDEPTNGLDPVGIADMRALIKKLSAERGITVFLSSHFLSEVQQVATRVGIIHEGRLIEEIGYEELRRRNREYLELVVSDAKRAVWVLEERCGVVDFAVHEHDTLRIYDGFERAEEFNRLLVEAGIGIQSSHMSEENLEDHFVKVTGGSAGDEPSPPPPDRKRRGWRR